MKNSITTGETLIAEEKEKMTLMHDVLMARVFHDNVELSQYVLNIMLNRTDLTIISSEAKREGLLFPDLKETYLDILALGDEEGLYRIRIHKIHKNFSYQKMRYYQGLLDADCMTMCPNEETFPHTILIALLEENYFNDNIPDHACDIKDKVSDQTFDSLMEWHILNLNYQNLETEFGKLMHDFNCDKSQDILLLPLKEKVQYFKEGPLSMSLEDDIRALFKEEFSLEEKAEKERAIKETKKSIISTMLKNGLSPEEISNMTDLPIDFVKEVQGK